MTSSNEDKLRFELNRKPIANSTTLSNEILIMTSQSNSYLRLHDIYSFRTFSCLIIFFVLIFQGPINVNAQVNQYESVIGLSNNNNNNNIRSSSTTSIPSNSEDMNDEDIYDEEPEELAISSTTKSNSLNKPLPHISTNLPIQPEEVLKGDYEEENDSYSNDDQIDNETTDNEDASFSDDNDSNKRPETNPITDPQTNNNRKDFDFSSTSRLPFGPANLWRDLFSQPGILVGIVGGVVIGMLAAILLVMFIIYRMRKKDEGSYALEEGPRKSPSHAYTRVSSREFFA